MQEVQQARPRCAVRLASRRLAPGLAQGHDVHPGQLRSSAYDGLAFQPRLERRFQGARHGDGQAGRKRGTLLKYCSIALPTADLSAFDGAAAIDLQGMAVQAIFDKYDLSRPGAYTPPIQGTLDPWLLSHDRAVPDVDSNVTGVHLAQLQRRERLRTSVLLRTKTRSDGSTRDLREPVWNAPPPDVPPSSSNPTGMFFLFLFSLSLASVFAVIFFRRRPMLTSRLPPASGCYYNSDYDGND